MKNLYLIRHAKSSWDHPGLKDIDRPLLQKGIKRTSKISAFLNREKATADLIISSPATRAYDTAKLIASGLGYAIEKIKIEKDIYFGDTESFFNAIYQVDNEINNLFIFGHNPTITQFANYFLHNKIDYLPTSGLANISFDTTNWTEIPKCKWEEKCVIFPKLLKTD